VSSVDAGNAGTPEPLFITPRLLPREEIPSSSLGGAACAGPRTSVTEPPLAFPGSRGLPVNFESAGGPIQPACLGGTRMWGSVSVMVHVCG
jgi:hypothetical protein